MFVGQAQVTETSQLSNNKQETGPAVTGTAYTHCGIRTVNTASALPPGVLTDRRVRGVTTATGEHGCLLCVPPKRMPTLNAQCSLFYPT